ncbi:Transposase [Succiniclasticum ruminis]|uniref:Transposase n=1 Tax=Succiniclasticum ruminis TaxID=40841 RepID=A0A1G6HN11_9FIRM|nr:transposase [Succiniclasticum ruminis]SDB95533.1 Transposase [Succiniclasticum ruminis]
MATTLLNILCHGYKVCILNPLQTSSFRRNNIRKTKTDKLGTFLIAKTLMANLTRFVTKRDIDILHLRNLGWFR